MGWESERAIALIAGPSGSGKTFFVANLPDAVIYDTDIGGGGAYADARIKRNGSERVEVSTFGEILDDLKARQKSGRMPKSIVIDHVTGLHQAAVIAANPDGAADYGRSGAQATAAWRQVREFARRLDANIFATAHLKSEWEKDKQVGRVADGAKNIEADMGIVLHLDRPVGADYPALARVIKWRRDPDDQRGRVPAAFEFTLEKFGQIAGVGFARASRPEPLAAPEQVAELRRLVGLVKLPDGKPDKTVAFLSDDAKLAGLTAAEADRGLSYLNKLIAPPAQKGK